MTGFDSTVAATVVAQAVGHDGVRAGAGPIGHGQGSVRLFAGIATHTGSRQPRCEPPVLRCSGVMARAMARACAPDRP
ncbi:hypothetical protein BSIN_4153 [Burkholderia singularis]|uniref:Uncharacterized protein n=1 Tax=Burkholderia singularis TaxID=1503053 RepID=A0A238H6P8_9BURK|nr:hypothetical protein BSIN_4153 [Burkholderia singularis]